MGEHWLKIKNHLPQILRFVVVGVSATLTHLGIFWFLLTFMGVWYGGATTIGFLGGFVVSFTLQKFWTFKNASTTGMHKQAGLFLLLQMGNLLLNLGLMVLLVDWLKAPAMVAQVGVLALLAVTTFVLSKLFIFRSA